MSAEKLLTTKEVAEILRISEEEVKELSEKGEIPAYKIGGIHLRFKQKQVEEIAKLRSTSHPAERQKTSGLRELKVKIRKENYTFAERLKDFFYFNDFYIISIIIILVILFIIFRI